MSVVTQILSHMSGVFAPKRRLLEHVLDLWPCVRGRFNFRNVSRYSGYCERSLRRHFTDEFDWGRFNTKWIEEAVPSHHHLVLAYDHSFIPKSGRHTPGLSWFWNGCAGRTEKGLELALLGVLDLERKTAYALHAQQTQPQDKDTQDTPKTCQDLTHLQESRRFWPQGVKHLVADGAFARRPFVDGVCQRGLEFVGKLRTDANVRYLFTGKQRGRGRPKLYNGKVVWKSFDPTHWHGEGELEKGVRLYSATLYHPSLKRNIKSLCCAKPPHQGGKLKS